MKSILLTGGARSGKSQMAQELAIKAGGEVLFVATAEAGDDEMQRRIEMHQKSRPKDWATLEAAIHVGTEITRNIGGAKTVIIDCITLLVNNILMQFDETTDAMVVEKAVMAEMDELLNCISRSKADFIIVTNEVGLGIVPGDRISRLYRDLLGKANQILADNVNEVYLLVAGIPIPVKKSK
ncbi:MAG: bifunctional adenosylcobinamide kinase/adenosylcobinamide-phosphate guanylyltransferase [Dehalococcoidales bacterium]